MKKPHLTPFVVEKPVSLRWLRGHYVRWVLQWHGGNKQRTAKSLKIGRQTLYNILHWG